MSTTTETAAAGPAIDSIRLALRDQIAALQREQGRLQVQARHLELLLEDPDLENLVLKLVGALRQGPLEDHIVEVFRAQGSAMRWTDVTQRLVERNLPVTPQQVLAELRHSSKVRESQRGWFQLVSQADAAAATAARRRAVNRSTHSIASTHSAVEVVPA